MPLSPRARRRCIFAALALAAAWRAVPPTRWLSQRVQFDRSVLGVKQPLLRIAAGERVLLVSPHLDDETLGAGGLLAHLAAQKIPVRVVFLTNGDGSGSTILALNFRHGRRFSFVESAQVRQKEALAALSKLGIAPQDVAFLGYPDGDLQTMWDRWDGAAVRSRFTHLTRVPYANAPGAGSNFTGSNLLRDLESQFESFRPTRVLSTHGADAHPDHWSADAFARLALQVLAERQSAPEIEHDGFVIHHGIFPLPHGNYPNERLNIPAPLLHADTDWRDFELSDAERQSKGTALEEYVSQLVFTPNYLRAFVRRNEPLDVTPNFERAGLWRDESAETWALATNPGADVRQVQARSAAEGLEIVVSLGAAPSQSVTCALGIKLLFAGGRVQARRLDVAHDRSELAARDAFTRRAAFVRSTSDGFQVTLGNSDLQDAKGEKPRCVVVDASTWSGAPESGAMLDRTESRALKLD